jgi:hypothetical protein
VILTLARTSSALLILAALKAKKGKEKEKALNMRNFRSWQGNLYKNHVSD